MCNVVQELTHRCQPRILEQQTVLLKIFFHFLNHSLLQTQVQCLQLLLLNGKCLFCQLPFRDFLLQLIVCAGKARRAVLNPLLKRRVGFLQFLCQVTKVDMHPHAGQDFLALKRLDYVVHSPGVESPYLLVHLRQRSHEDNRDVASRFHGLEPLAGFETVDARHEHIQQDQIGPG
ncbi:MAG: hypothetical protein ACD_55C00121G0003 [uncultured bacterium]|nr:MAG: hypothetical protein ACD_55C00121G0003 [uncultured bacterium]